MKKGSVGQWLKTDGTIESVVPGNGKRFSLAELQKYVGGYIEMVKTIAPVHTMYVNEEGLLNNLPINEAASAAIDLRRYACVGGKVRGNAIIIGHRTQPR